MFLGSTPGQCETTWLILRQFYWELMNMRKTTYMLQDKWYFESIITDLYAVAEQLKPKKAVVVSLDEDSIQATRIDLAKSTPTVVEPKQNSKPQTTGPVPTKLLTAAQNPIVAKPLNNIQPVLNKPTTTVRPYGIKMPKISSAKSLAISDNSLNIGNRGLQITPIRPAALPTGSASIYDAPLASTTMMPNIVRPPTVAYPTPVSLIEASALSSTSKPITTTTFGYEPSQGNSNNIMPNLVQTFPNVSAALPVLRPSTSINSTPMTLNTAGTIRPIVLNSLYHNKQNNLSNEPSISHLTPSSVIASTQQTIQTEPNPFRPIKPTTTQSTTTAAASSPLPRITGAVSLLNPNEIMIELISSPSGNVLLVHGPPLTAKYSMSMPQTARFIREIMAIPQLHSKTYNGTPSVSVFWQYISQKFDLPSKFPDILTEFIYL